MASYLIIKSCVAGGSARIAGEIVELRDDEAKTLVAIGRVIAHEAKQVDEIVDRSIGLDHSESTKISKRGRKS